MAEEDCRLRMFPDLQDNLNDSSAVCQLSMVTSGGTGSAATNNIGRV